MLTLAALFGLVIWVGFIIILFRSSAADQLGAKMLLINAPAFLGFTFAAALSTRKAVLFGVIATSVQLSIMAAMLAVIPGADILAVVGINAGIALSVLALTLAAWLHSARRGSKEHEQPSGSNLEPDSFLSIEVGSEKPGGR